MKQVKNKITTAGYFLRRLRESGFVAIRLYSKFGDHDPRKWSIMVDPEGASLVITCYQNKEYNGDVSFSFDDGGANFIPNFKLRTQSMEVMITTLLEKGVSQKGSSSNFVKPT